MLSRKSLLLAIGLIVIQYPAAFAQEEVHGELFLNGGFNSGPPGVGWTVGGGIGVRIPGRFTPVLNLQYSRFSTSQIIYASAAIQFDLSASSVRPYLVLGGGLFGRSHSKEGPIPALDSRGVHAGIGIDFLTAGYGNLFVETLIIVGLTERGSDKYNTVSAGVTINLEGARKQE